MSQQETLAVPKIFISYSWTTREHEEWVVELATRLVHDGIDVKFDKWDLKEGHDVNAFMESMVTSPDIDKVLIVCDRGYKEKADERRGGVGTETQIITPEIYKDIKQEKFIPIVAERDEQGEHFIPAYIASRMYIDLSINDSFEDSYEKLVRAIFGAPLYKKPQLGNRPSFLSENGSNSFKTTFVVRKIKAQFDKEPSRMKFHWLEFTEVFHETLKEFRIEGITDSSEIDQLVIDMIDKSLPLRDDFINVIELFCQAEIIDVDNLIDFFEGIYSYTEFQGNGSFFKIQFDQYKFIINELFVYLATILLKHKFYSKLASLLNSEYYVRSRYTNDKGLSFVNFRFYLESLELRNQRLKLGRVNLHADLLVQRASSKYKDDLLHADLLLYYISKFRGRTWFPNTTIYLDGYSVVFKILNRLKSKAHFENVKVLFNVETDVMMKKRIAEFESDSGFSRSHYYDIPNIRHYIQPDDICSLP